jgi:hypothetical protein
MSFRRENMKRGRKKGKMTKKTEERGKIKGNLKLKG